MNQEGALAGNFAAEAQDLAADAGTPLSPVTQPELGLGVMRPLTQEDRLA